MIMNNHRKKLIENFFSLSVLQGANYILPLLTVPYLVRVLGPAKFGLVAFAQAFAQYFVLFTDYGFNFSATREVSIHRFDHKRLEEIFSSVVAAKFLFTLFSVLIYGLIIVLFARFRQDWLLYAFAFTIVPGNIFFFQWFFQGMEKMKYITVLNIFAKLFFVVLIFIFVRTEQDYALSALFYSLGFVLAGVISLFVVYKYFNIRLHVPSFNAIVKELRSGYYVFISQLAPSLYTTSNVFILGLLTNNTVVGYYSAGEKLIKAVQSMLNPFSQTIFPHISALSKISKQEALKFVRKAIIISGVFTFAASLFMLIFAPQIVRIIFGENYSSSINVIRILSFVPFISSFGIILGAQIMINFGMSHIFAWIVTSAGLLNIALACLLIPMFRQNGMALAVVVTETIISLSMFIALEMKQLSPRKKWVERNK